MKLWLPTGQFDQEKAVQDSVKTAKLVEKASRENPETVKNYVIGHIMPLGQLDNQTNEFNSKYIFIAYEIASEFGVQVNDFSEINIYTNGVSDVTVQSLENSLNAMIEQSLGKGWRIAVFNSSLKSVLDEYQKDQEQLTNIQQVSKNIAEIVGKALDEMKNSTKEKPYRHDLINLFYADCDTIDAKLYKLKQKDMNTQDGVENGETCNKLKIEIMVYDRYANGIRLLTNFEQFASTRIRQHIQNDDKVWAFVLKARTVQDGPEYCPTRQFNGSTTVQSKNDIQGCCKRIIYTLVNKNYNHWNFISLPIGSKHNYQIL